VVQAGLMRSQLNRLGQLTTAPITVKNSLMLTHFGGAGKKSSRRREFFTAVACFLGLTVCSVSVQADTWPDLIGARPAQPTYLDIDAPTTQISRGQQPFPNVGDVDETPSQMNSTQLNQLFQFETTPDICAAGEAYVTANFDYLKFPGSVKEYRYQVQGQYGLTDQIAVGAYIPVISAKTRGTDTGFGDVGIYGQYKLDKFINPEIIDVTVQADFVLPTGNHTELRDTGHFGFRPLVLAYKDFGIQGPGRLGAYAFFGFTVTTNSDVRFGLAGTYQYNDVVGVLEFYDQAGDNFGRPLVQLTPGIVYRGFHPFEVAVGVPIGVNSGTPDWGINFKLSYVFQ
jgi:hypothetical protein